MYTHAHTHFIISIYLCASGTHLPRSPLLFVRFINKLQPGSVKKVNESTQNWHQVSSDTTYLFVFYFSNED